MAFRGNSYKPKTKKKQTSLYHTYTDIDIKRVSWCMDKNIHVAVSPGETKWQIEIALKKSINLDPKTYEAKEAYEQMYKYYKYYYDKYNKQQGL